MKTMPDPIVTMRLGDKVPDLSDYVSDEFMVMSVNDHAIHTETAVMNTADTHAYLALMPRVHNFSASVDPREVEWQVFDIGSLVDEEEGA